MKLTVAMLRTMAMTRLPDGKGVFGLDRFRGYWIYKTGRVVVKLASLNYCFVALITTNVRSSIMKFAVVLFASLAAQAYG